jgi:hypothetical protein
VSPDEPDPGPDPVDLDVEQAVAEVYGGPLDGFVARRDALVKQLRAAGRADDAGRVKALRKPRLNAWALDALATADPSEAERLASAVAALAEAQSGRGEVRPATTQLRTVVNEFAAGAARQAAEAGHTVDPSNLVPALLVVAGEPEALADLRAGRLVDIPTASGMGLLAVAPPGASAEVTLRAVPDLAPGGPRGEGPERPADRKAVAAAQRRLDDAEATVDSARSEVETAEAAVGDATADAEAAEERLRQAESDVREARTQVRETQRAARTAGQHLREAERAAARARAALDALGAT